MSILNKLFGVVTPSFSSLSQNASAVTRMNVSTDKLRKKLFYLLKKTTDISLWNAIANTDNKSQECSTFDGSAVRIKILTQIDIGNEESLRSCLKFIHEALKYQDHSNVQLGSTKYSHRMPHKLSTDGWKLFEVSEENSRLIDRMGSVIPGFYMLHPLYDTKQPLSLLKLFHNPDNLETRPILLFKYNSGDVKSIESAHGSNSVLLKVNNEQVQKLHEYAQQQKQTLNEELNRNGREQSDKLVNLSRQNVESLDEILKRGIDRNSDQFKTYYTKKEEEITHHEIQFTKQKQEKLLTVRPIANVTFENLNVVHSLPLPMSPTIHAITITSINQYRPSFRFQSSPSTLVSSLSLSNPSFAKKEESTFGSKDFQTNTNSSVPASVISQTNPDLFRRTTLPSRELPEYNPPTSGFRV